MAAYQLIEPKAGSKKLYIVRADGSWCFTFQLTDRRACKTTLTKLNRIK